MTDRAYDYSATIADVALLAGVSTATVSRVTSGTSVRPEMRVKVLRAIEQLGYVPNAGPRFLRTKRSGKLLAIVSTLSDPTSSQIVHAVAEAASRSGYGILLGVTEGDARRQRGYAAMLRSREAEGLICIGEEFQIDSLAWMRSGRLAEVPAVTISEQGAIPGVSAVVFDSAVAAGDALQELHRRGHSDILVISGGASDPKCRRQLVQVREVAEHCRISRSLRFISTDGSLLSGASAALESFGWSPKPTAILCLNDVLAAGALHVVQRHPTWVVHDLSIIAIEQFGLCSTLAPALSTMRAPYASIGEASVKLLVDRIRRVASGESVVELKYDLAECLQIDGGRPAAGWNSRRRRVRRRPRA